MVKVNVVKVNAEVNKQLMRKLLFIFAFVTLPVVFTACGDGNSPKETTEQATDHKDHVHYQCPMKCEGDKVYDEPGKCPVCKMDLKEVSEG